MTTTKIDLRSGMRLANLFFTTHRLIYDCERKNLEISTPYICAHLWIDIMSGGQFG